MKLAGLATLKSGAERRAKSWQRAIDYSLPEQRAARPLRRRLFSHYATISFNYAAKPGAIATASPP